MKRGIQYSKETHKGINPPDDRSLLWHKPKSDELRYWSDSSLAWELLSDNGGGGSGNNTQFEVLDLDCIEGQTSFTVPNVIEHIIAISAAGKSLEVSEYSFNNNIIELNLGYTLDSQDKVSLSYSY
jgi:hypothetical protein